MTNSKRLNRSKRDKVVRSICYFTRKPNKSVEKELDRLESELEERDFRVQTKRICCPEKGFNELKESVENESLFLSIGSKEEVGDIKEDFFEAEDVAFNLDLTNKKIKQYHVDFLFEMIEESPESTFSFCYAFNNPASSPYHPPAEFEEEGFSIGLQPTNLSKGCESLEEWLENMKAVWKEIEELFQEREDFLGIDSSIAPFSDGESSLVNFLERLDVDFKDSGLTDNYLRITDFIKQENPCPVGLCGLMLPCLEDFELADEYEKDNFSIERNIYLSLHSGLGIDTYPIGVDENPEKVKNILKTVQKLSKKHDKPLSIRFVSDGEAKIGEETEFGNQYLKDVKVRKLE